MTTAPAANIYGVGTPVSTGYPVYASKDASGTYATPFGSYVWNGTAWVTWPTDANGNPLVNVASRLTLLASTTAVLAASGVYTSATFDASQYKTLTGTISADQAGTLLIQQSWNGGTNWDGVYELDLTIAVSPTSFSVPVIAPSCQIKYTNGAAAQTSFRLYVGGRTA